MSLVILTVVSLSRFAHGCLSPSSAAYPFGYRLLQQSVWFVSDKRLDLRSVSDTSVMSSSSSTPPRSHDFGLTDSQTSRPSSAVDEGTTSTRSSRQRVYTQRSDPPEAPIASSSRRPPASPPRGRHSASDDPWAAPAEQIRNMTLSSEGTVHSPSRGSASPAQPIAGPSHADPFRTYRDIPTSGTHSTPSSSSPVRKPKRARYTLPERPFSGIQPHPAFSPRYESTPPDYTNAFIHLHPWGKYFADRAYWTDLTEEMVTGELPLHVYRPIHPSGYFNSSFVRSLFPRRFVGNPSAANPLPIWELQRMPDIIAFRQHAVRLIEDLLSDTYRDDSAIINRLPASVGEPMTQLLPPLLANDVQPVLYQVVNRYYGSGVILEAKDFCIPGPDHRELQCLPMTQDSVNYLSRTRGFDRTRVSVKDFVWVLTLRPTSHALEHDDRLQLLRNARLPRPSAMEVARPFFFRVHEFILVPPSASRRNVLGMILSVARRGQHGQTVNHVYAAFEGCHESVRLAPSVCTFPLHQAEREDLLLAEMRTNVSCAMRFCHPAISADAQRDLLVEIRRFLPAHPGEAITPLRVDMLPQEHRAWIEDRLGDFSGYQHHRRVARRRMGKLFAVASASLASQAFVTDDKRTHELIAFVPSIDALPLRLELEIPSMPTDGGRTRSRGVDVWLVNSTTMARARIHQQWYDFSTKIVQLELFVDTRSEHQLRDAILYNGNLLGNSSAQVRVCVRLTRAATGTDPVFEILASENLFSTLDPNASIHANDILDQVYGGRDRPSRARSPPPPDNLEVTLRGRRLQLRPDQARAVRMGMENHPVMAIQAAYGTGKTVLGALIAARLARPGQLVIATATTNVAVAQFTDTLLDLDEFDHLPVLRFVADTSLQEGAPTTPVDLHAVPQGLLAKYSDSLTPQEARRLRRYQRGRRLIETLLFHPERTVHLSDDEREEYRIAEMFNSEATERAVAILFRLEFPAIICMTTASLLNTTKPGGLFHEAFACCRTIIGDEASQIPEPVFVSLLTRFPLSRHIYIGDVHQLQPHLRCPRESLAAQLGGRGVMSLLMRKDVPLAPLVTTFRAHPALNELPNTLVYDGALVSETPAHRRSGLIRRLSLPNPDVPFVMVNARGISYTASSTSYYNEAEEQCCRDLLRALLSRDVPASSIGVISFYKEQQLRLQEYANRLGIPVHTVDSVQGREMDVVIVLTTRTDITTATGDFLNDIKRMNVALTRCKHGQFVLGWLRALRTLPNWSRVIDWAGAHDAIVEKSLLPDVFA